MASSVNFKKPKRAASRGVTLIELALSIMLMTIIGIAVSSLIRGGIEAQMSQRLVNVSQVVAMNVVDDLRFDLRTAQTAAISNGGNRLDITNANGDNIIYTYNGTQIRRQKTNAPVSDRIYNANIAPAMRFFCGDVPGSAIAAPCFSGQRVNKVVGPPPTFNIVADNATPQTIVVAEIAVAPANNVDTSSVIAKNFDGDTNPTTALPMQLFTVRSASYDVASNASYN